MTGLANALSCSFGTWTYVREGDPGLAGWLPVALYLCAAIACTAVALRHRTDRADRSFWASLAVLLLVLAINKQLDLHILFSRTMRCLASENGWSDEVRRVLQRRTLMTIGLCIAAVMGLLLARLRHRLCKLRAPIAGLGLIALFVAIRASSFNQLDGALHMILTRNAVKDVLELAGPVVILVAGIRSLSARA